MQVSEAGSYVNLTASSTISGSPKLIGFLCSTVTAAGTVTITDDNGTLVNGLSPIAGQFYVVPFQCTGTCTVTITGTIDITVGFN
jgi:hypothetical protein